MISFLLSDIISARMRNAIDSRLFMDAARRIEADKMFMLETSFFLFCALLSFIHRRDRMK